jgi:two-component system response regulator DevR
VISVFLLDDHEVVRRGLRELLEAEVDIEVVGEAGTAQDAIHRAPALRPNVAVLDARLPDGSGIDAIRRVASGQSLLDPAVTQRVLERIRNPQHLPDQLKGLTDQERKILGYVADGLTNRQIAAQMFLAEKTVKNYVSSLLAKLGLERRTQAAVFAVKLKDQQ